MNAGKGTMPEKKELAGIALIFFTVLLWAALLATTGINSNDFFTFKFEFVMEKVFTVNTMLFILALPIPTAIAAALSKGIAKRRLMLTSTIAAGIALCIAFLAFPETQGLWLLGAFYLLGISLAIEAAASSHTELKDWVSLRASHSAASKATTAITIGLIVFSIATVIPEHEQFLEKTEAFLKDIALNYSAGESQAGLSQGAKESLAEQMANAVVLSQIETMNLVTKGEPYSKLREKTDPDVITFVATTDAQTQVLKSQEYRQAIEQKFLENSSVAIQTPEAQKMIEELNLIEAMKESLPALRAMERIAPLGIWFGILHAVTLAGVFSLVAAFALNPLGALYGVIATKAKETLEGKKSKATIK